MEIWLTLHTATDGSIALIISVHVNVQSDDYNCNNIICEAANFIVHRLLTIGKCSEECPS